MSNETIFADGFIFKRKENAPDFVVGSQSIKVEEAIAWVNLDIKQSKGGKYYCQLDTWQPNPKKDVMEIINKKDEEVPF